MPQLRKDPVVSRWVIIATERARRPGNFVTYQNVDFGNKKDCPFCRNTDPEIYAIRPHGGGADSWLVKVAPSGTPLLSIDTKFKRHGFGVYDVIENYGAHEIVIETPEHIANMADLPQEQIQRVLQAYAARFKDLEKDANLQYIFAYKNYGLASGSRPIGHARSQIIASPVNPLRVKEKLAGAKKYYDYHERCLYCDLYRQEIERGERLIEETGHFVAITPFAPRFPFEVMILPKKHGCDFADGVSGLEGDLALIMKNVLLRFKIGLDDPAYNYIIHTSPLRQKRKEEKWQTIEEDYHWHIEIMPRLTKAAGFEKGSGFYICSIPPEDTADFLRKVDIHA